MANLVKIGVFCVFLAGFLASEVESRRRYRGRGRVPEVEPLEETNVENPRDAKFLSLFNVVNFANEQCTSTDAAITAGTCFTAAECGSRGGSSSGTCAAGFGVCCTFSIAGTSGTVSNNNTHIRNTGFPATSSSGVSTYTVKKVSPDVCQLRLDFETFNLMGITLTTEAATAVCMDTFKVTTSTSQSIPTICGQNTGMHMYVDMGRDAGDMVTIAVNLASGMTNTARSWDINTQQISCNSAERAPPGCLQYVTGASGRFTTFNYANTAQGHLPAQKYSYCIRPEMGFCCVRHNVCGVTPGSAAPSAAFSIQAVDPVDNVQGQQDEICLQDYIGIPGGSSSCVRNFVDGDVDSRYCGTFFSDQQGATTHTSICSCQQPLRIDVFTDSGVDGTLAANPTLSHGVCLDWVQLPC